MKEVEETKESEKRDVAYEFLKSQDKHLVRLLYWVKLLEHFSKEIEAWDVDNELFDEIKKIQDRLTMEIGIRMRLIFPCAN